MLLAVVALALSFILTHFVGDLFQRLAVLYAILVPLALLVIPMDWRKLMRFDPRKAVIGLGAGLALYVIGWVGFWLMRQIAPDLAAQAGVFYGWLTDVSLLTTVLLFWIIVGEDMFWRFSVTLPMAERWNSWAALAGGAAFASIHLPWGPPLLLIAALVFGTAWSWLAIRTRNFWCVLISHLVWDGLVMEVLPYV